MKRNLLFLLGCIPARLGLTFLAYKKVPFLYVLTFIAGVGFFYYYFSGTRNVGRETLGKPIWWNRFRPVHGILFILYSYLAYRGHNDAYKVLFADTMFGLGLFVGNRVGMV